MSGEGGDRVRVTPGMHIHLEPQKVSLSECGAGQLQPAEPRSRWIRSSQLQDVLETLVGTNREDWEGTPKRHQPLGHLDLCVASPTPLRPQFSVLLFVAVAIPVTQEPQGRRRGHQVGSRPPLRRQLSAGLSRGPGGTDGHNAQAEGDPSLLLPCWWSLGLPPCSTPTLRSTVYPGS